MAIESFPIYGLLRGLMRWLPRFLIRRHYTAERLAGLIYLDVYPRGDAVMINLGQVASAQVTLQLINLSPFPIQIEQARFELDCAGVRISLSHLSRKAIESGEVATLCLDEQMPDGAANAIANAHQERMKVWLSGNVEFNSEIRNFGKRVGALSDIYPWIVNANARNRSQ